VIEHETHLVSPTVDSTDPLAKRDDQLVQAREKDIGKNRSFQVAPQPLDQVQARAIRRQPKHLDLIPMRLEPLSNGLGVVEPAVVADQANLPTRISLDQRDQKDEEVRPALARSDRVNDLTRGVIHPAVDHLLLVLSRRGNFGLMTHWRPHPAQRRMAMNLNFVLENQGFRSVFLQRFFFNRVSCLPAFSKAASSRLPFIVCLGR
jgi:hypothetical protein